MFDSHIHSSHSHDSKQTLDEICLSTIEKGIKGVAICDHVDMVHAKMLNLFEEMKSCIDDIKCAREKYPQIKIFQGIEMAEYLYDEKGANEILSLDEFDIILGSVHTLIYDEYTDSYSRVDFSDKSEKSVKEFLKRYFIKLAEMIEKTDIDVVAHLTCPMRYINGKYKRNADVLEFKEIIRDILDMIINKKLALEINTSGLAGGFNDFLPQREIIKMYKKMGGELITIASDAHIPQNIGYGFNEAKEFLKETGFTHYCYYESRNPVKVSI